jgi:hypothetical protein
MKDFSNSLLMLAAREDKPETLATLMKDSRAGALGWHYAARTKFSTETKFIKNHDLISVQKELMGEFSSGVVEWQQNFPGTMG